VGGMDRGDSEEDIGMLLQRGMCLEPCRVFVQNYLTLAVDMCWDMPLFERTQRLNEGMCRGTNVVNVLVGCVGFRKRCW
jgi:hypothetical protein